MLEREDYTIEEPMPVVEWVVNDNVGDVDDVVDVNSCKSDYQDFNIFETTLEIHVLNNNLSVFLQQCTMKEPVTLLGVVFFGLFHLILVMPCVALLFNEKVLFKDKLGIVFLIIVFGIFPVAYFALTGHVIPT